MPNETFQFDLMIGEVGDEILKKYGGMCLPGYSAMRISDVNEIQHFFSSDDEMALEFLVLCFKVFHNPGQEGVDAINLILQEEDLGYKLSPYIETLTEKIGNWNGLPLGAIVDIQHPRIIKRDSEYLHAEAVEPALELLSDERYKNANQEFLEANEHFRYSRFKDCLNCCLRAFESTMKIICHDKKWEYDQKDTAHKLIQVCLKNNLVETFSEQQLTSLRTLLESAVPTARNRRAGHGMGTEQYEVSEPLAKWALSMTAANIRLLVESAEGK